MVEANRTQLAAPVNFVDRTESVGPFKFVWDESDDFNGTGATTAVDVVDEGEMQFNNINEEDAAITRIAER